MGGMLMVVVALLSAFLAMRLAIHGREVEVPNLAGLTLQEASEKAGDLGLSLHLENKFYSTDTPSGHILSQFPAPGATVRKAWSIRITESLGSQQVEIPDLVGQTERPASLALRRSSLELGVVASIPAPGEAGVVLAQTPPPNAAGIDRPRVSILLSQPAGGGGADRGAAEAFVMPQLTGLPVGTASARAAAVGLRAYVAAAADVAGAEAGDAAAAGTSAGADAGADAVGGVVAGQSPMAGHRVVRGESVRLTLAQ